MNLVTAVDHTMRSCSTALMLAARADKQAANCGSHGW